MPSVLIEVRKKYSPEEETAIMTAAHSALQESFKIFPHDKNVRLIAHEPHRFAYPPDRDKPEVYTHISIDCFAVRSLDAKRNPLKKTSDYLVEFENAIKEADKKPIIQVIK
jgi:hypothetical protein